jgi:hypothetical protein
MPEDDQKRGDEADGARHAPTHGDEPDETDVARAERGPRTETDSETDAKTETDSGTDTDSETDTSDMDSETETDSGTGTGSEAAPATPPATRPTTVSPARSRRATAIAALAVFVVSAGVYVAMLGDRIAAPSPDNHYVHLAASFLEGELGVLGNRPPGNNDWACYDTVEHGPCPNNQFSFPASLAERYRWYVSFPPFPAVVMMPFVAIGGTDIPDRAIWAVLGGFGPMLLFLLLRRLRSERRLYEDLVLSALFAFGTVFFFTAVQGTVWFAAHVVAVPLVCLFFSFALESRRPVLAGLMLGLAFMCRPPALFLGAFFLVEALAHARRIETPIDGAWWKRAAIWVSRTDWRRAAPKLALFLVPLVAVGLVAMWMNNARFESPFEFGHTYLQIRWRDRIEKWGLFNFHFFAKNLAVYVAALPWLSALPPYITISRHGLALWFTTPHLMLAPFPKRAVTPAMIGLFVSVAAVALLNLCYQNSGWVQFGYRFALDYMVGIFMLLALGGRRFGVGFYALMLFAIAVNAFGAVTFDRAWVYYNDDPSQNVIFQPD